MSERYAVGTQVQVKNEGHGSQFRTETERVGRFAGTVIATSGPDYTGIPEVCVESATGERRVILVGDLEEAPEPAPCAKKLNPSRIINHDMLKGADPQNIVCLRDADHRGRHRATRLMDRDSLVWEDDACVPAPEPKTPSEFQVKIWYASGAYEQTDHVPVGLATTIYAEAESNDRVVVGEIHGCATGKLYQSFRHGLDPASVVG